MVLEGEDLPVLVAGVSQSVINNLRSQWQTAVNKYMDYNINSPCTR